MEKIWLLVQKSKKFIIEISVYKGGFQKTAWLSSFFRCIIYSMVNFQYPKDKVNE